MTEMAADIGRSERTIRNYESDATPATANVVRRYAVRTDTPVSWLMTGTTPTDVPPNTPASECQFVLVAA